MPVSQPPFYSIQRGIYITLHSSDGNAKFKPPREQRERKTYEGQMIDYMYEVPSDHDTSKHWKLKIGSFLARHVLNLPDASRKGYTLSAFPAGYTLYTHCKGPLADPRKDTYLYGSSTANVFRSPAEFLFHAKWLLLGCPTPETVPLSHDVTLWGPPLPEEVNNKCMCCYCSDTSQIYISQKFSNYTPKKT